MGKKSIILTVVIVLIIGGIGFWYWQSRNAAMAPGTGTGQSLNTPAASVTQEASKSMGATIFEKTQDQLTTKLPETNPLKRVIKNPFE